MNQEEKKICRQSYFAAFSLCSRNNCFVARKLFAILSNFIEQIFDCSIYEAIFTALPFHFNWFGWRSIFLLLQHISRSNERNKNSMEIYAQSKWVRKMLWLQKNEWCGQKLCKPMPISRNKSKRILWSFAQWLFHTHRWEAHHFVNCLLISIDNH